MQKKITIIGADSFIAQCFVRSLPSIYSIQLFSRRSTAQANEKVIDDFFTLSEKDFKGSDIIINFAAIVHQPGLKDDQLYKRVNTQLPIFLASLAKSVGVKQFIQMSTIAVYGKASHITQDTVEQADDIYGKTKLAADQTILQLSDAGFVVSLIRPPMVYGGGNSPGNLMRLLKLSLKGFPLPLKGIVNKRSFIHVENLALCLQTVIQHEIMGIILPADPYPVSTSEILAIVSKNTNRKIRQFKIPGILLQLAKRLRPELISKLFDKLEIESNLGEDIFQPQKNIENGIAEMMHYLNSTQ